MSNNINTKIIDTNELSGKASIWETSWQLLHKYKNSKGENCGHCCIYDDENKKIFHAHGSDGTPTGYTGDLSTYWVKTFGIPKVYRK